MRIERSFTKKEEGLREQMRQYEKLIQEEKEKSAGLEAALKTFHKGTETAIENKLLELTKKNSILDLNLMRLTRKFTHLEEQEKMLRKEYHAKDADMAEKDLFV